MHPYLHRMNQMKQLEDLNNYILGANREPKKTKDSKELSGEETRVIGSIGPTGDFAPFVDVFGFWATY